MTRRIRSLRAGTGKPKQGEPLRPPLVSASNYQLAGDPEVAPRQYGRLDNPTWEAFEAALGELDGGVATSFASGMAAVSAVLLSHLRPGDTVVLPSDGYYTVRNLADHCLCEMGVEVRLIPTASPVVSSAARSVSNAVHQAPTTASQPAPTASPAPTADHPALRACPDYEQAVKGAKLVWLETPCNPGLDVADIHAVAEVAHDEGAILAVDNTVATPLGQGPLKLGADHCVYSITKVMGGHFDLVLGAVVSRDEETAEPIRRWRNLTGAVCGPFEAWLAQRSLMTLTIRLEAQCQNALEVAKWLAGQPAVQRVRYPGLAQDPANKVAAAQMELFGSLVTFELPGAEQADRLLDSLELIHQTTSFGGVESTAERRSRWADDQSPPGLIRLSVGCEDAADLISDLDRALGATS